MVYKLDSRSPAGYLVREATATQHQLNAVVDVPTNRGVCRRESEKKTKNCDKTAEVEVFTSIPIWVAVAPETADARVLRLNIKMPYLHAVTNLILL